MSNTNIIAVTAVAGAVNVYSAYSKGGAETLPKTILANAALMATLVGFGQLVDADLAAMLAILYLIGTMFTNGLPAINFVTDIVGA